MIAQGLSRDSIPQNFLSPFPLVHHVCGDMMKSMSFLEANDTDLVTASRAGDRDAFGEIVSRYQSLVCSVAYSATGGLAQSEDLAQETFVAAWKSLGHLNDPSRLRSWLCGIARNRDGSFRCPRLFHAATNVSCARSSLCARLPVEE